MTSSEPTRIEELTFASETLSHWREEKGRHHDWPVVYLINNSKKIYVGESTRVKHRLFQHLTESKKPESPKQGLREIRIVLNDEFNKSACLDLESRLIAWLHADSHFAPVNRNDGQQNAGYFERESRYQAIFDEVFERLRKAGLFTRKVSEIENLNMFKLSPFKALNDEQLVAVDQIVDEAHRLTHRGAGATRGLLNANSRALFPDRAEEVTAVDWIIEKSNHQVFLVDGEQTVRPADVPADVTRALVRRAKDAHRYYSLESQMRVSAGDDYLEFARTLLTDQPQKPSVPSSYDLRFFDDMSEIRELIEQKEAEVSLSRMVAGYAWPWASKGNLTDAAPYDIELDGERVRWNRTHIDWISSATSAEEMGCVHTTQGYDLNYAGVVIGPDIVWDGATQQIVAARESHFDPEVRTVRDQDELLEYIRNAYYVLLTRGMLGTYIYVCDPALRERIRALFRF